MEGMYKKLGKKVRKYRKDKNITSLELADRLDISVGHISNIENGKSDIFKLKLLFNLAKELDTTVEELLNITDLGLGNIVFNTSKIEIDYVNPTNIDNKSILVLNTYLKLLINHYLDAATHCDYEEHYIEAITNHMIDELSFVNKLNKFKNFSPIA